MKQQARAAVLGRGANPASEASPYISEFIQRQRLAKLGYVTNIAELDALKAEIFGIIDFEIEKAKIEQMKRK